ncbi:MAG: hypothetical protein ACKPKB_08290, partial [Dolichospermum sp.]
DHTANRISVALMVGFIKHTFGLPLSFFESRYVGDIVSRVQENQKIQHQLTIGQLVAFNMLLGNIIQPFQRLIILWNQLQEVIVATERINDVLEAEPEEDLEHKPRQYLPRLIGKI